MKKIMILVVASIVAMPAMSQVIKLVEGSLDALKGQTAIAIEFNYDNMLIGNAKKNKPEQDYINEKKAKANEKEPGKGDAWAQTWVDNRKNKYEPKFTEYFAKFSKLTVTPGSTYTLLVKTTITEPGFNAGLVYSDAFVDAELSVVEAATQKVIAKITVFRSPGAKSYDFDEGIRLEASYQRAATVAGQFIARQIKK